MKLLVRSTNFLSNARIGMIVKIMKDQTTTKMLIWVVPEEEPFAKLSTATATRNAIVLKREAFNHRVLKKKYTCLYRRSE